MKETGYLWKPALPVRGKLCSPRTNHTFHCVLARQTLSIIYTCILVNKTWTQRSNIMSCLVCFAEENRGLLAPRETFFFFFGFHCHFPLWKGGDILALVASVFTITKNKTSIFQVNLRSKAQLSFLNNSWIFLTWSALLMMSTRRKLGRAAQLSKAKTLGSSLKFSEIWSKLSIYYKVELQKQG